MLGTMRNLLPLTVLLLTACPKHTDPPEMAPSFVIRSAEGSCDTDRYFLPVPHYAPYSVEERINVEGLGAIWQQGIARAWHDDDNLILVCHSNAYRWKVTWIQVYGELVATPVPAEGR
jgi:hypothetical protein